MDNLSPPSSTGSSPPLYEGDEPLLVDDEEARAILEAPSRSSSNGDQGSSEEDDAHLEGLTSSEREILTLLAVDKKLASVLDLAAAALSSLRPTPANQVILVGNASALGAFKAHASEYYKALDVRFPPSSAYSADTHPMFPLHYAQDIQLTLRNSIHLIRRARISPNLLLDNPPQSSVLRGVIAPGAIDEKVGLGKGALRMEKLAWMDIRSALERLSSERSKTSEAA
ncbi:MAG: hypothetical protein CYPHOPRED_004396 [Cyphobasidiales sp. Tagirdzhanova-0007]|nr:MAG: hypothetical protein CYPHOPRED_004396 [Cyphobasidiales sp. Tagirdzhanova-0007]